MATRKLIHHQIYYSMLFLGIVAAGGIFTGTNPSYTTFELRHHLKVSRARFIIAEPDMLHTIRNAAEQEGVSSCNVLAFDVQNQGVPHGILSWSTLMTHGEADWARFDDHETSSSTPAALLFSSGTTGLPKAATLSHYNFVAQHTLAVSPNPVTYEARRSLSLPRVFANQNLDIAFDLSSHVPRRHGAHRPHDTI
jgi:4-coumarate--CoA ligase